METKNISKSSDKVENESFVCVGWPVNKGNICQIKIPELIARMRFMNVSNFVDKMIVLKLWYEFDRLKKGKTISIQGMYAS
jgi:hypothetical protein